MAYMTELKYNKTLEQVREWLWAETRVGVYPHEKVTEALTHSFHLGQKSMLGDVKLVCQEEFDKFPKDHCGIPVFVNPKGEFYPAPPAEGGVE